MQHSKELDDLCNHSHPSVREMGNILKESAEYDQRMQPWYKFVAVIAMVLVGAKVFGFI